MHFKKKILIFAQNYIILIKKRVVGKKRKKQMGTILFLLQTPSRNISKQPAQQLRCKDNLISTLFLVSRKSSDGTLFQSFSCKITGKMAF